MHGLKSPWCKQLANIRYSKILKAHQSILVAEFESTGGSQNIREAIYFGPANKSSSKEGTFPQPNDVRDFGDTVRSYMEQIKRIGYGFFLTS